MAIECCTVIFTVVCSHLYLFDFSLWQFVVGQRSCCRRLWDDIFDGSLHVGHRPAQILRLMLLRLELWSWLLLNILIMALLLLHPTGQTCCLPSCVQVMLVTIIYFKHRLCPYFLKFLLESVVVFALEDWDFDVFGWDRLVWWHHVLFVERVLI